MPPMKSWRFFDATSTLNSDCGDIAIFEIDSKRMSAEEMSFIPALDIEKHPPPQLNIGSRLFVKGFPSFFNDMDYDGQKWVRESVNLEACYDGPSDTRGTSAFSFLEIKNLSTLDGMSGAPVFAWEGVDSQTIRSAFVGMMILAKRFTDHSVVMHALRSAANKV